MAVNSIVGWQFASTVVRSILDADTPRLLTMDFGFPCAKRCNLSCKYCFIETDEREQDCLHNVRAEKLSVVQLKNVFRDARTLGCQSAKLVGDQEATIEKAFLEFVRYVSDDLKMWLVIFTNGLVLADDEVCKRVHGVSSAEMIDVLRGLRVSLMLKFHSFSNEIEDEIVRVKGYAEKRDRVLARLIDAGFTEPPEFESNEEKMAMTGCGPSEVPETWTRLGLESVLTPQCLPEVERIYRLKSERRLYVDLDPPVPVGLTRNAEWRAKTGMAISKEDALDVAKRIYVLNAEMGIPFVGASPYLGGLPCSQLPYSLYVSTKGHIYPCCGCPDQNSTGGSDFLGNVGELDGLRKALDRNPYRQQYKAHGCAYDKEPFNRPDHPGFGVYHGCVYRDRAGDIMPENWELAVEEHLAHLRGVNRSVAD